MDTLIYDVVKRDAPENFKEYWDTYFIYDASTTYKGVIYKAWGTEPEEAIRKVQSLIIMDKTNGIIREPGEVVE